MRILLLSQFYPPVAGGVEVHVAALAEGLAARGHDVAVGTLDGDAVSPASPVTVHGLPSTTGRFGMLFSTERHHAPPFPDPGTTLGLRGLVAAFEPDIVHAHNWIGRSYLPLARSSGARYVETLHDCALVCAQTRRMHRGEAYCDADSPGRCVACCSAFYGPLKGPVTALGNRAMRGAELRAVDLFLPVSRAVAEANQLDRLGARYEVVPNFVAERQAAADRTASATLPAEPFILQVGDVVADKGVHVLFDAYRSLESPPPLVLIGRIADDVRGQLPPGAIATGIWPHERVPEAWRACLFGTMPSLCLDACPTVTMEAMAAGKPVIAAARGGLRDQVVDGVTGTLVPPGDPDALAAAMRSLVADPALRQRMGLAARRRYEEHYRADVVIDRIDRLYGSLLP